MAPELRKRRSFLARRICGPDIRSGLFSLHDGAIKIDVTLRSYAYEAACLYIGPHNPGQAGVITLFLVFDLPDPVTTPGYGTSPAAGGRRAPGCTPARPATSTPRAGIRCTARPNHAPAGSSTARPGRLPAARSGGRPASRRDDRTGGTGPNRQLWRAPDRGAADAAGSTAAAGPSVRAAAACPTPPRGSAGPAQPTSTTRVRAAGTGRAPPGPGS